MKRVLCLALLLCLLAGCSAGSEGTQASSLTKEDYAINMNTDFPACTGLAEGGGRKAKVILLLGQSNASGCSLVDYLQKNLDAAEFAKLEAGFKNVKINFCIDNQKYSSGGQFVPVDLRCGSGDGCFGPEVGMAEVLSTAFPEEEIFILKYTMSGYSLNHHWLYEGKPAWIYDAALVFIRQYMEALSEAGYDADLQAIAWMQGESDTTTEKAERYFDNQVALVSYLRSSLAEFADGEIYFVDAGISSSPYCEPGYPAVNEAKRRFAELSPYNLYFDTIDMGLTTLYEPVDKPDLGHYDSLSELALGRKFGELLVDCLKTKNKKGRCRDETDIEFGAAAVSAGGLLRHTRHCLDRKI